MLAAGAWVTCHKFVNCFFTFFVTDSISSRSLLTLAEAKRIKKQCQRNVEHVKRCLHKSLKVKSFFALEKTMLAMFTSRFCLCLHHLMLSVQMFADSLTSGECANRKTDWNHRRHPSSIISSGWAMPEDLFSHLHAMLLMKVSKMFSSLPTTRRSRLASFNEKV